MPHVCECTCARLSLAHTFSSCLSFLSVCTSCSLLSPHANISSSFLLSGAPDPRVHNTRCLHKLSERKSRLQDTKMKAKMVFDSLRAAPPKQTIGRESRDVKARVPFFFSEDSHTKQITSPVIVPYMVTYGTEGDPSVLATQHHTHCNNAKLFAIAPGEKSVHRTV